MFDSALVQNSTTNQYTNCKLSSSVSVIKQQFPDNSQENLAPHNSATDYMGNRKSAWLAACWNCCSSFTITHAFRSDRASPLLLTVFTAAGCVKYYYQRKGDCEVSAGLCTTWPQPSPQSCELPEPTLHPPQQGRCRWWPSRSRPLSDA